MQIGDHTVGDGVYYVAEAGVNHAGDPERARALIDAASEAGVDAVKFQTFDPEALVTSDATISSYQRERTDAESQRELLDRYELDPETYRELAAHARERGVHFLSSPFDPGSADLLDALDVPAVKIGSGELTNHPLLAHVATFDRPVICSTGMATMDEVRAAAAVLADTRVVWLHCVSAYPTEPSDVNLAAMDRLDAELDDPVGLSDHTTHPETPAMAVACGASVVEKHFTLDRSLPGPDQAASLEPDELAESVALARRAARVRGDPHKRPVAAERENRVVARKSLHATRDLAAGDSVTADDVAILRPAEGLPPTVLDRVVGARLTERVPAGAPITRDALADAVTVTGADPFPEADDEETDYASDETRSEETTGRDRPDAPGGGEP